MKDNRIRIKEAMLKAKKQGSEVKQCDAAEFAFPGKNKHSSVVRLGNYTRGDSTKIDRQQVLALSLVYDSSPDQLFGWEEYLRELEDDTGS